MDTDMVRAFELQISLCRPGARALAGEFGWNPAAARWVTIVAEVPDPTLVAERPIFLVRADDGSEFESSWSDLTLV